MKQNLRSVGSLLVYVVVSACAFAASPDPTFDFNGSERALKLDSLPVNGTGVVAACGPLELPEVSWKTATVNFHPYQDESSLTPEGILRQEAMRVSSPYARTSELSGKWINSYPFFNSAQKSGGSTVTVTPVADSDTEVTISDFWLAGISVRAVVDLENSRIDIPVQTVTRRSDGNTVSIAPCNMMSGSPVRNMSLSLSINPDGSLSTSQWWGIFYDSDDYYYEEYWKDEPVAIYDGMKFERGNTVMSHTNVTTGENLEYPVIASQTGRNVITVVNFLGYGQTVDLVLNRDKTLTCRSQTGYMNLSAPYMTCGNFVLSDGKPVSWTDDFAIAYDPASPETLRFGNVSLMYSRSSWVGLIDNVEIRLGFIPDFPEPYGDSFKGSGTAEDPWLIAGYNDLALLSDLVNSDTDLNYYIQDASGNTVYFARSYLGKHFKMVSDIDMTGYDFTPVGVDGKHWFAATFDGNGKTIRGMKINGSSGYAALFGIIDPEGTVKNLNMEDISVYTASLYAGVIASRSEGVISNCRVSRSVVNVDNGWQAAGGIAGYTNVLRDCVVENCDIFAAEGYAGGLAAQFFGPVDNCHVSASKVHSTLYNSKVMPPIGGLAATSVAPVSDCSFSGYVGVAPNTSYGAIVGGLVGFMTGLESGVSLSRSFFTGTVCASPTTLFYTSYAGGLVGELVAHIRDCHASGTVYAPACPNAGGLTGIVMHMTHPETGVMLQPEISSSYSAIWLNSGNTGYEPSETTCLELLGASDPENPPVVNHSYFDSDMTDLGSLGYGVPTRVLVAGDQLEGYDNDIWVFSRDAYPRLRSMASSPDSHLASSALVFDDKSRRDLTTGTLRIGALGNTEFGFRINGEFRQTGRFAAISGDMLTLNDRLEFGNDTVVIRNNGAEREFLLTVAPVPWEGDGTANRPWLVRTKEDLLALARMTSDCQFSYPGSHFMMTDDIDMEYDDAFNGISFCNSTGGAGFHGTFDGGGHTLHRLRIGRLEWSVRPEDDPEGRGTVNTVVSRASCAGLFGIVAFDGTVRNVVIAEDCEYQGYTYVGGIAGYCYGTIENCINHASVMSLETGAAGIAAYAGSESVIRGCLNTGDVTCGHDRAAGIVSTGYSLVESCVNTGDIRSLPIYATTNLRYAGGIVGLGNSCMVRDCLNTGLVSAPDGYVGGIVGSPIKSTLYNGYKTDICQNLNVGAVESGKLLCGAIGGSGATAGSIENNFYDISMNPEKGYNMADRVGVTGVETAMLVSGAVVDGLPSGSWHFAEGMYPVPVWFMDNPYVEEARTMYVIFADGDNRLDVTLPAVLNRAGAVEWQTEGEDGFAVSGNILLPPEAAKEVTYAQLEARGAFASRTIPLRHVPSPSWTGDGSPENPWQIETAGDWNLIADLIAVTETDFEGKCFILVSDIDFSDEDFRPVGVSPYKFSGKFDGNGKRISNFVLEPSATYAGPFGILGAEGEIKGLTLDGHISGDVQYIGGFAGKCYGTIRDCVNLSDITSSKAYVGGFTAMAYTGAVFERCVNRGNIHTTGTGACGYLAGIAAKTEYGITYDGCGNEATITTEGTSGYIGGLVGYACESSFTDCYNSADLINPKVEIAGGLVAYMYGSAARELGYTFLRCRNSGNVTALSKLGGIAGSCITYSGAVNTRMDSCCNTGRIVCMTESGTAGVGGLLGMYAPDSEYSDCWNSGDVVVEGQASAVGGIAGDYANVGSAARPIRFVNCRNTGHVGNLGHGWWTGGIVGLSTTYVTIEGCRNFAPVEARYGAGGIVGALYGTLATVKRSVNTAPVTVSSRYAGGIAGCSGNVYAGSASSRIEMCLNSGDVKSVSDVIGTSVGNDSADGHGIGGIAGQVAGTVAVSANFGSVSGPTFVGGIVGEPQMDKSSARTCISASYCSAPVMALPGGESAGIVVTSLSSLWNPTFNTVSDSYYVTDFGLTGESETGSPVSMSELTDTYISSDWELPGDYILPIPTDMKDDDAWKCMAAAVIVAPDDSWKSVKGNFHVGTPDGVAWSVSASDIPLVIEGNDASWTAFYTGPLSLEATCGEYVRTVGLEANVTTGMSETGDCDEISVRRCFTPDGIETVMPSVPDGRMYIVITRYADGSERVEKLYNR